MKNLYTKNEFLTLHNDGEMINEGFLGNLFKSLFANTVKLGKKIKGSKEINAVYDKYKKLIDSTFAKMGNVGHAENAVNTAAKPTAEPAKVEPVKQQKQTITKQPVSKQKQTTNAPPATATSESAIYEAEVAAAQPASQPVAQDTNTTEQKNLVNLSPEKLAKAAKLTEDRVTELKKQFETEINAIITKLSKDPQYTSDELNQYSVVMKNQFNSYVFEQWYGLYQKSGDQNKLTELTTAKKESDAKLKQSLDLLNTKLGEESKQIEVKKGGKYTYHSKSQNKDITVSVLSAGLGTDENGKVDKTKPEYKGMYKVKSGENVFWVSPSALKGTVKAIKEPIKAEKIKPEVGQTYKYTNLAGDEVDVKVTKMSKDPKRVIVDYTKKDGTPATDISVEMVKLKPKEAPKAQGEATKATAQAQPVKKK